ATSTASGAGGAAGSASGNAAGNGQAMAFGNLGQLAAAGSGAADASGMFAISPGMTIEDAKGRSVGTVQSVRATGEGVVQTVIVESGNHVAELPAANFTGSGSALVSAMGKGEIKKEAKEQDETAQGQQ
ncbi:MAG TPA: hypothetical protein VJM79_09045, partial [Rhizorhapis sp.]|nr:hypothetical protein [Rhizorhapis sp.]